MRKFLVVIFGVTIAFIVSSCKKNALSIDPNTLDNITYKCWYVTVSQLSNGNQTSSSWYEWNCERGLVMTLQMNRDVPGYSATYKECLKYAGQFECERANAKVK